MLLTDQPRLIQHGINQRQADDLRFLELTDKDLTLEQLRGMEGVRVREAYAEASRRTGVEWKGRSYDRGNWGSTNPVNRALSCANSCLYGICHAAIVSAGYSPALGFIHLGKQLSFVYDVADLYKAEMTIPAAFDAATGGGTGLERRVRLGCRDRFAQADLLGRIVKDIDFVLGVEVEGDGENVWDSDPARPGQLWDPERGGVEGGQAYGEDKEEAIP